MRQVESFREPPCSDATLLEGLPVVSEGGVSVNRDAVGAGMQLGDEAADTYRIS
jgi:hypothetical protein